MKLERIYTPGLAQIAYIIGDEQAGVAAVIDPRRDIEEYLALAQSHGLRISHIFETHVHADFVSGAPELAATTGATIYASRLGASGFAHTPLDDGDVIEVGSLKVQALFTPGHTPEHMAYLVTDPAISERPQLLFSGDMLFVGEVGRPDLLGEAQTAALVSQLFESIRERLIPLDDDIIVYPGHGAGSACGKKIGDSPSTTIGQEKRFNYAFQIPDRAAFSTEIMVGMPPAPTYYPKLKQVNKAGAILLKELPHGHPLAADDVAARMDAGALVIDARAPEAFGGAHIPGTIFAGLGPNFTAWMGWLAPFDADIILVLEHDDQFEDARTELRRIGLDRVAGYLQGGMAAWTASGRDIATLPQISVHDLHAALATTSVLDVRSADEWNSERIDGATHQYAADIVRGDLPADTAGPFALICGSGYRSSVAASVLQRAGRDELVNVIGGMAAWQAAGLPVDTGAANG
jgi:hydroxyacylglutathione hydrolase